MARWVASADGRYEPHETPPPRRALATAAQLALMLVPRMILLPLLVVRVAGSGSAVESRVVVASIVVSSLLILLTTVGPGRLRTHNLYLPTVDPISVPFCILALKDGGVGTLAVLVIVTGLFQVVVGMRLSRLRRFMGLVRPARHRRGVRSRVLHPSPVLPDSRPRRLDPDEHLFDPHAVRLVAPAPLHRLPGGPGANGRLGMGSIASGLVGSLPLSSSPVGVRFINQTKCASRRVGALVAVLFLAVAVVPKAWAAVVAVPRALVVVYFLFIVVPLFATVVKSQKQSFRQARNIVLIGLPVLVGLVIEIGLVDFPDNAFWDAVTKHGLLAGSLLLVVGAVAFNAAEHRRSVETELDVASIATIRNFMNDFAAQRSWADGTRARLEAVAEEALLVLMQQTSAPGEEAPKRLRVAATARGSTVEVEFASGPTGAENLEDRIALLADPESDMSELEIERDVSLRLLRHHATTVNHRQYNEAEIITAVVTVDGDGN